MISLKAKIGEDLANFPLREFALKKMDAFLNAPEIATAFIAPGGFGKSTLIALLTEKYFTGEEAKFPNDVVTLIDGSILMNLLNLNTREKQLYNLIEFDLKNSYSVYFRENPDQVQGRVVLIIDGLNEIYYQAEKLTYFIENLMTIIASYENIGWFKLIVTCRPENWKIFTNIFQKNPYLKSKWFDVNFDGSTDSTNVPLLSQNEIKYFLEKNSSSISFENLSFHNPEIIEIINNPYLLHLFCMSNPQENIQSDIELLNQFVYKKILIEPFLEEKSAILNSMLDLTELARQDSAVNKEELPRSEDFHYAYNELISNNILFEYTILGEYLSVTTYVKFTHAILLGFLLANKWIKDNEFNLELIRKAFRFYKNNPQLQRNILKFLIKFAFREENTEILKDIYTVFESEKDLQFAQDISQYNPEIINVVATELRNSKRMREYLIPLYAKSELGQMFYFERYFDFDSLVLHSGNDIDYYLKYKHSADAKLYGYFLKFMQYFLAGDPVNCKKVYEILQGFDLPQNINPRNAGYFYGVLVVYQSVFEKYLKPELMKRISRMSDFSYKTGTQPGNKIPNLEFLVVYCLNYGNRFAEILEIVERVNSRYDISGYSTSWHYQIFYSIYARALLNTGQPQKGLELFNQIEFIPVSTHHKYYVKIRYYLIKAEFLIFEGKIKEAKRLLDEIKKISRTIRHKFFFDKAVGLEGKTT